MSSSRRHERLCVCDVICLMYAVYPFRSYQFLSYHERLPIGSHLKAWKSFSRSKAVRWEINSVDVVKQYWLGKSIH